MLHRTLADEAARIADRLQARVPALQTELRGIEERKRQIDMELCSAALSGERLSRYQQKIGEERQCPQCWLREGTNVGLSCLDGTEDRDIYQCPACGFDWAEPA